MAENQNIEYKQSWRDEYLKWVSGFANASGGRIYIGKDDKGNVVGVEDTKVLLEEIPNKIVNSMGIVADVNLLVSKGKEFIEVVVSPSSVPISYKGVFYYRSGSTKQELKGSALSQFLLMRQGRSWDDMPCIGAQLSDIDHAAIKYFMSKAKLTGRIATDIDSSDTKIFLENLNLINLQGKLKNAAVLLFGKNPAKFFPSVSFRIGRFGQTDDDLRFQDIVDGNIITMADKVVDILKSKYLIYPIKYEGLQRIEKLEIPEDALREAIFNAIVHKDYTGAAIQMSVYNDKIQIWNEGRLPDGFTVETLLVKHPSKPYNKIIADIFFRAGFIESWGRGISKIVNGFLTYGLLAPVFEQAMGGLMVTVFRDGVEDVLSFDTNEVKNDTNIVGFDTNEVNNDTNDPSFDTNKPKNDTDGPSFDANEVENDTDTSVFDTNKTKNDTDVPSFDTNKQKNDTDVSHFDTNKVENDYYVPRGGINKAKGTERINLLVNFIRNNNLITISELSIACKSSVETIKRDIRKLNEQGVLKRIGNNKTGSWQIVDNKTLDDIPDNTINDPGVPYVVLKNVPNNFNVIIVDNRVGLILNLLRANNRISIAELAAACKTSTKTIKRDLQKLKAEGRISRNGNTRNTSWTVTEIFTNNEN